LHKNLFMLRLKLQLPICKIWCDLFQHFRSLVYFTFGPKSFVDRWTVK